MGSTNLNAPTLKTTSAAVGAVVMLHVLVAAGLAMTKTPAPVMPPIAESAPIEIELVTPPKPAPKTVEINPEPIKAPEPKVAITEPPKPIKEPVKPEVKKSEVKKPEPKKLTPQKTEVAEIKKPDVKREVVKPKAEPVKPTETVKPVRPEPFEHEVVKDKQLTPVIADTSAADKRREMLAQEQAAKEQAARQAQIEAERAAAAREAQAAKAEREAQAERDKAAAEQAKKAAEAARIAAEKAAAKEAARKKAAKAAASNTPVNFTASNANWASMPNFSFPNRAARGARSGDTYQVVLVLRVNKQGGIDSVQLAQSSGNALLDREAQRQVRSGKFRPFTQNGVPVVGNVTLPISYAVP